MRGKPTRRVYTKDELIAHGKGDDYVAKRLAEQETLNNYESLSVEPIPQHLDEAAQKEWKRIIPLLNELPIAELDRELTETYCMLHSSRLSLMQSIRDNGESYVVEDREGNEVVRKNPAYDMMLATVREIRMIAHQLGMTMSGRLDLATPDAEDEEDAFLELLKG